MDDNPLKSRYPNRKQYQEELKFTMRSGSKGCVHINDMIDWMVTQSHEMMQGTEFENEWHWYHDALSIMWAPETIAYIKSKYPGVYERMLRGHGPTDAEYIKVYVEDEEGHLVEKMVKNRYRGRLGGDISRNMPLDSSLFQDFILVSSPPPPPPLPFPSPPQ